ncbi:hypothetical protein vBEcoMWL3_gp126 [Escherichia phage vB_EcoM_WL-3]|nr:hypothetical protein vBEcoMWL3_gp126 [Escherichia phage vB_EcoM_WL-3]
MKISYSRGPFSVSIKKSKFTVLNLRSSFTNLT